ncbi:FMN-dependent NADH-azoreductase 3 [Bacillus cereus VD014]|uniref:FMN-dependent NADH-azoreductase 3 n=2 Tax=Bacillaceae TaxID=186817 RepID=A0A9W5NQG8_BACC8|nr:FMN-dependent NADH-azoreductase 3 [Bacillus cereus VD014]
MEMAVKYVASMMSFFGVKDMEKVVIEGHNQFPDKAEKIITTGLEKAVKVASTF